MKIKKQKLTPSERTKKWKSDNYEKHREQWLRYYQKHKEEIKEIKKEQYKLNKSNE